MELTEEQIAIQEICSKLNKKESEIWLEGVDMKTAKGRRSGVHGRSATWTKFKDECGFATNFGQYVVLNEDKFMLACLKYL